MFLGQEADKGKKGWKPSLQGASMNKALQANLFYNRIPCYCSNRNGTKNTTKLNSDSSGKYNESKNRDPLITGTIGRPMPIVQINSQFSMEY